MVRRRAGQPLEEAFAVVATSRAIFVAGVNWSGDTSHDVGLADSWVRAGAEYIGGCCRVGPSDIALAQRLGE